jgi:prepilin-type N-terminal cleavage/methylation domain-containing protein
MLMISIFSCISKAKIIFKNKRSFTLLETLVALSVAAIVILAVISSFSFSTRIMENAITKMKQKLALLKAFSMHRHNEITPSSQNGMLIIPEIEDNVASEKVVAVSWTIISEQHPSSGIVVNLKEIKSPAYKQAGLFEK